MHVHKTTILFLANAIAVLAANPWFAFYNDNACKEGQGISVSGNNDGCLQEYGRLSVGPTGGTDDFYNPVLVAYSDNNCENEIGCNDLGLGNGAIECYAFDGDPSSTYFGFAKGAQSFKFISGSPPTCPGGCAGVTNGSC